jgi:hypothetical protein
MSAAAAEPTDPPRIEARSSDLLAVGVVHDERMTIHLSRLIDNAPVRDATLAVVLRGSTHPAVAEADGSYAVETPDLRLPGSAAVQFLVTQGAVHEVLGGMLEGQRSTEAESQGNSRQLGWWALNFGVCIGFLLLWSRRKKKTAAD